ncbi:hypothetical protein TEA_014804 [Camellia sinensis var. sinensis]|uniref:DNA topoisomerase 2 n=1 Tax=Camellia sinensis var. sinensis TaxID=542762 RepID=A0A4S4EIX2_CAMSN|nr:hypothetical protein TEA_014804 [Camellia sinensis var. sinensis]
MLNKLYSSVSSQSMARMEELRMEDQNVKRKRERCQKQSSLLSKLTRQLSIHDNRAVPSHRVGDGKAEREDEDQGTQAEHWEVKRFSNSEKTRSYDLQILHAVCVQLLVKYLPFKTVLLLLQPWSFLGGLQEKDISLSGEHVREGLTCVISVKVPNPEFEGQTKTRLGNPEVRKVVDQSVQEYLTEYLELHPDVLDSILSKSLNALKAALAAKRARELVRQKSVLKSSSIPGKLADCSATNPEESGVIEARLEATLRHGIEPFIFRQYSPKVCISQFEKYLLLKEIRPVVAQNKVVTGASRSDPFGLRVIRKIMLCSLFTSCLSNELQKAEPVAVLPLRGKILNIERRDEAAMYKNEEIQNLILALGLGVKGEDFKKEALRYHKIIILTDADVDGAHIRTLLLTFFFRYQRALFDEGYIYVGVPPLYKVERGKQAYYCYDETDLKRLQSSFPPNASYNIQRFKGLGEMMPLQLWETTLDPERRLLKQLVVEDAAEANVVFSSLMGSRFSTCVVAWHKKLSINPIHEPDPSAPEQTKSRCRSCSCISFIGKLQLVIHGRL